MFDYIESEILKGKYFTPQSRDRLRATLVNLFIFIGSILMLFYAYDNLLQERYFLLIVELMILFVLVSGYLMFPYYTSIEEASYAILGSMTFMLSLSMVLPDKHPELSIFWLASLPVFSFYFLGLYQGLRWNIYMFMLLATLLLLSYVLDVQLVYKLSLLAQIVVGFIIVSSMLYIIEREKSQNEKSLDLELSKNEILLKEVHHRTKNNMQVIMGLLESQSFKIDDPKYRKIFEAHIDRLKAMSLIHKNLYTNQDFGSVDISSYLAEILNNLNLYSEYDIDAQIDEVMMDMGTAINIGLIVNEAVTNSIEHAFVDDDASIVVRLTKEAGRYLLLISDNGIGFDTACSYPSLGITLIGDLAKTLENGEISMCGDNGTTIKIYFTLPKESR